MNSLVKTQNQLTTPKPHIAKGSDLVLADLSGSMRTFVQNGLTKIDCLRLALEQVETRVSVLGFADRVSPIQVEQITNDFVELGHGTRLDKALAQAQRLEPVHILVMCDGSPSYREECLGLADQISELCIIDALFIGSESDIVGRTFMRQLAEAGRGRYREFDLVAASEPRQLGSRIAGLLAAPVSTKIEL